MGWDGVFGNRGGGGVTIIFHSNVEGNWMMGGVEISMGSLPQNVVLTVARALQLDIIKPISHRSSSAIMTGHSRINPPIIIIP